MALTFSEPAPEMRALADAAVQRLDALRAPLTPREIERRLQSRLSPRQEALLGRWGYPYVFDEFRFNMTLTGSLAAAEPRERLPTQRTAPFPPLLTEPAPESEVSLSSPAHRSKRFVLVARIPPGPHATSARRRGGTGGGSQWS